MDRSDVALAIVLTMTIMYVHITGDRGLRAYLRGAALGMAPDIAVWAIPWALEDWRATWPLTCPRPRTPPRVGKPRGCGGHLQCAEEAMSAPAAPTAEFSRHPRYHFYPR
jgi:hypothetical protein